MTHSTTTINAGTQPSPSTRRPHSARVLISIDVRRSEFSRVLRRVQEHTGTFRLPSSRGIGVVTDVRLVLPDIEIAVAVPRGAPLRTVFDEQMPAPGTVLDIGIQVARRVESALWDWSSRGPIIASIQPENVWIGRDGDVAVHGFGLWSAWQSLAMEGIVPAACPPFPEALSHAVAGRTDVYAVARLVGSLLYATLPNACANPAAFRESLRARLLDEATAQDVRTSVIDDVSATSPELAGMLRGQDSRLKTHIWMLDDATQDARRELAALLDAALDPDPRRRPHLRTFIDELEAIRERVEGTDVATLIGRGAVVSQVGLLRMRPAWLQTAPSRRVAGATSSNRPSDDSLHDTGLPMSTAPV